MKFLSRFLAPFRHRSKETQATKLVDLASLVNYLPRPSLRHDCCSAGTRRLGAIATILLVATAGNGQTHPQGNNKKAPTKKAAIPVYQIVLSEDKDYPAISWRKDRHSVETSCNGDGNVFVWKGPLGLFGLTPKGVISFSHEKLKDIPNPSVTWSAADIAVSDTGVYYRASGAKDEDIARKTEVITDSQGIEQTVLTGESLRSRQYIAHFDNDGHYDGAISDLPLTIFRVAVFNSGTLIVQGRDKSGRPRVALLDSGGQLLRYLELPKDISSGLDPLPSGIFRPCDDCQAIDIESVLFSSHFTAWQQDVLFYRVGTGNTVYDISEGGRVRSVNVKAPHGYNVHSLIAMDRSWLVDFYAPDSSEHRLLFEVDPETGNLLREYRLKDAETTTLSCFGNREFWGLRRDEKDSKLKVVRGNAQLP